MTTPLWRNPMLYGLLGFLLVAAPSLFFFFAGISGTQVTVMQTGSNETSATETVWIGAFNPFLLVFVIGAALAAWGCYRSTPMAWAGSLFVFAYSILAMFSIGLLTLPGAVLLVIGAALKTISRSV